MKNYKKLISASEGYLKSETSQAQQTKMLGEALALQSNTGIQDLDQGINSVVDIINVMFANRTETTKFFNEQIVPNIKKNYTTYPIILTNFEKRYDNDIKRANGAVSNAEKKMKLQPTELKKILEEVKAAEALRQQCTVQGLQDTTRMVRELYCGTIQLFADLFEKEKNSLEQIVKVLKENAHEIQKVGAASDNIGEEVSELIKAKKQTLIDLKLLTPEFKAVLKAAGMKRKDLCNPETVQLLISTVEQAVKEGKCDQSVLDQLTAQPGSENSLVKNAVVETAVNEELKAFEEDVDDIFVKSPALNDKNVKEQSDVPQMKKPEEKVEEKPINTKVPPPQAPRLKDKIQEPQITTPTDAPLLPPSDLLPPPGLAPPAGLAPPPNIPPPPQSNKQAPAVKPKASFLDDINKGGHILKKTEPLPQKKMTAAQQGDLTSMLATAMANRRKDIQDDEESEEASDDEWSD
ncbi:hypothetical protein EIN_032000 [Entamoeba invadens IP1]|uniref:Uncharacterized protein n=1 Tax=Entamoeba invadens IP1 TaxID=370355 RepID=A0A0A1TY99_ENTIV|nr:hypothetical protein EIN_032000 [Entamoeba invadens IP1]ELP86449.1 hypothetical protein EIN_032000 [Entamoeba invadens IP1]|eukprot:XP_004185795.1 hypothetical protein EIN_032000 [Entamoeba invadens IP1]